MMILASVGNVNWNLKNKLGQTPLSRLLLCNRPECAQYIVGIPGVDLTVKDNERNTLAHYAVKVGNIDCVQILVGLDGIQWNDKNDIGEIPVLVALAENDFDVVKLLVMVTNIDTNIRDMIRNSFEDICR